MLWVFRQFESVVKITATFLKQLSKPVDIMLNSKI